jgi:hypothetical protein
MSLVFVFSQGMLREVLNVAFQALILTHPRLVYPVLNITGADHRQDDLPPAGLRWGVQRKGQQSWQRTRLSPAPSHLPPGPPSYYHESGRVVERGWGGGMCRASGGGVELGDVISNDSC